MSVHSIGSLPFVPIAVGLVALMLALVRTAAWVAVGAWWAPDVDDAATLPASVIVGAAVTGACYAVCALAGQIHLALVLDGVIAAVACAANWRIVARHAGAVLTHVRGLIGRGRAGKAIALAWIAWAWLVAAAPPRDADVLRYHLAHIQQTVTEGRWARIADTAYALPFGWSLTYLPFEVLHISVGPQMINLIVWCITILAVYRARGARDSACMRLFALLLACQPMVFKAATTAHADAYTMMLMAVVAILIGRAAALTNGMMWMLGFIAWVGIQSRYQAYAIGAAASIVLVVLASKRLVPRRALVAAAGGAVVAVVLALPFYIANLRWFGDPVWPFFVSSSGATATAAERVARLLAQRTVEPFGLHWLPSGLLRLAIDITVFPIPWLVAGALIVGWRRPPSRWVAALVSVYLIIWALVEPSLFPRFIVFLVPALPLLIGIGQPDALAPDRGTGGRRDRWQILTLSLALAVAASAAFTAVLNVEAVRYVFTGDRARYDQGTWFAPVFAWADDSLPRDARVLVVVKAGGTYWLDRPYRRADPEGSAEVDWSTIADGRALADTLRAGGYRYLIYDDRDWSLYPGGTQMMRVVHEAAAQGVLESVTALPVQLVTSRLMHRWVMDTVRVWGVAAERSGASLPHPGTSH